MRLFPPTGAVYQVSKEDDGHHPWWSHDGREPALIGVVPVGQGASGKTNASEIQVVLNWAEELKRLVPST